MWTSDTVDELENDFNEIVINDESCCFIKEVDAKVVAFAHCALRHDYVEGTGSTPIGYLEGIFVKEDYRDQGIAKDLVFTCEAWAREKSCTEFASDCELGNGESLNFHMAIGFQEANRIICFTKKI